MKIVAAPNSLKESLSAIEACEIIATTLEGLSSEFKVVKFPVGDGGDGTLEAVVYSGKGTFKTFKVHGPLLTPVEARIGIISNGKVAFVEMAEASGLKLVPPEKRNPLYTSTLGTGELIKNVIELGIKDIILGVGGSATVDGGIGALFALGFKFLDEKGQEVSPDGRGLVNFRKIAPPPKIPDVRLKIAVDVMNPLLGEKGAVRVYGPQKGLKSEYFEQFEEGLARLRKEIKKLIGKDIDVEGAGAAGGIAGSFYGLLNAEIKSGIELVLEILNFDQLLQQGIDLVITGEGKLDYQTLFGKAPFGVASHAHKFDIPVIAIAGGIEDEDKLLEHFDSIFPIVRGPMSLSEALKTAKDNLRNTIRSIGSLILAI